MTQADTIYFAGDLFDHKHLIGNAILATYIERVSNGRYVCKVPQNFEVVQNRGIDVRNIDLKGVMECDFGIFNFDGPDLDSGTVVEYIFAKMLDIPAVILRSDFRRSGDGKNHHWNLMATNYPRAEFVKMPSMRWYKEEYLQADDLESLTDRLYTRIATPMVEALDRVRQIPPLPKPDHFSFDYIYEWALQFPAKGFAEFCGPEFAEQVLARKRAKGLL